MNLPGLNFQLVLFAVSGLELANPFGIAGQFTDRPFVILAAVIAKMVQQLFEFGVILLHERHDSRFPLGGDGKLGFVLGRNSLFRGI